MSVESLLTLFLVGLAVAALVREWLAPVLTLVGAMVVLLLTGIIRPDQALSGFANPAPITVAALFVVARAVEKTGLLQVFLARTLSAGAGARRNLFALLAPVAGASAFLNNTPIVAMLIGPIQAWSSRYGKPASLYLMPISYATMLGGMGTLIGTSTNLVVSGLLVASGFPALGIFEFSSIGIPVALVGVLCLIVTAPMLLPNRKGIKRRFEDEIREFSVEMEVRTDGPADGATVADVGLRHLEGVFLAWIRRAGKVISPVGPDEMLRAGDRLGFVGSVSRIVDLQAIPGLRSAEAKHAAEIEDGQHGFFEAVIAAISPLAGTTLRAADFRERYQASVLAIHRSGERVTGKLGDVTLQPGDTLLILADRHFRENWRDRRDFLLVSELDGSTPVGSRKSAFVLLVALAVVALAAFDVVPILQGSLAAACLMVLGRVLTPNEARAAVDLDTLVTIAASFALGAAIESSGLADFIAGGIVNTTAGTAPVVVLAIVVAATMLLTELITNNAAAVLVFPIAIAAAERVGAEPRAFAIAIALAASASFLTPIGYQTNTMIYGPGGYRFGDFARLGFPLTIIVFVGIVGLTALQQGLL